MKFNKSADNAALVCLIRVCGDVDNVHPHSNIMLHLGDVTAKKNKRNKLWPKSFMITMVHAVMPESLRVTYRFPKTPEELIQISGLLHTTKTVRGWRSTTSTAGLNLDDI